MKRFKYHARGLGTDLGRMALKVVCAKEGTYMTKAKYYPKVLKQAQVAFFNRCGDKQMNMNSLRSAISPAVVEALRSFRRSQEK